MAICAATSFSPSIHQSTSYPGLSCYNNKLSYLSLSSSSSLFSTRLVHATSVRPTAFPRKGVSPLVVKVSVERSYVMIKPDGVQRGMVGEIISRFERKGFVMKGLKLFKCPKDLAEEHYKDLSSKPFFPSLVQYITSGPVVCMALEGPGVVASARKLIGVTNPLQAEPGTIRGDLAIQTGRNVIHGSDSPENGEREIALWFKEGELCEWEPTLTPWLRE